MKGWIVENKELKWVNLRKPRVTNDAVLLRARYATVCGSDIALIEGKKIKGYKEGTVLGHEYYGVVEKTGKNIDKVLIGKLAAVNPYIPCKKCDKCKEKKYNLCENLEMIGTHKNGGFSEYSVVPAENLISDIPEDLGVLVQPVACALHAVDRLRPDNLPELSFYCQNPPNIVVFGGGPMGLLIAYFCKIKLGAGKIFLIEKNKNRRKKYGSLITDELLDPEAGEAKMLNQVISETNGGADIAVDAVGNLFGYAYRYVKEDGKILLFGLNNEAKVQFDLTKNEIRKIWIIEDKRFHIIGSYLALSNDFQEAVNWLKYGSSYWKFFNSLVTPLRPPLEDLDIWLPLIKNGEVLKPVFYNS